MFTRLLRNNPAEPSNHIDNVIWTVTSAVRKNAATRVPDG
jgi:hypothetical protein